MKLKLEILPNIFIENKNFTFAKAYMLKGKNVLLQFQTMVICISKTKSVHLTLNVKISMLIKIACTCPHLPYSTVNKRVDAGCIKR